MADIRSFFSSKGGKKSVIEKTEKKRKKPDKKFQTKEDKKGRLVIESDSDSEEPLPTKSKKQAKEKTNTATKTSEKSPDNQKKSTEVLKPTTASDFFGRDTTTSGKRKQAASPVKTNDHKKSPAGKSSSPSSLSTPPKKKKKLDESPVHKPKSSKKTLEESPVPKPKVQNIDDEIIIPDDDDDIIEPTPPPTKKSSSNKLSQKMKTSKETKTKKEREGKDVKTPTKEKPKETAASQEKAETPAEKKKGYFHYKNRDGPSALGSKELPQASDDCLTGLTFVITGVMDAFERDTVVDCIQRYGGKVTTGVSGKTSYVIVGREPGQSKMDKVAKHKTRQLDEDGFIELLKKHPAKTKKVESPVKKTLLTPQTSQKGRSPTSSSSSQRSDSRSTTPKSITPRMLSQNTSSPYSQSSQNTQSPNAAKIATSDQLLWVDKYKPTQMKQIVGQSGEKSNANKLKKWLINWHENNTPKSDKPKKHFMSGKEDGSIFKAALLSGPPGVGKTTTATLVCEAMGFSYVEMNASDTRGKKALETVIKESLSNVTVDGMIQRENALGRNHCLIMDEVDGMAGNEDRGGMQELIQLIKKSKIPIICMCNDRNHPKIRSLANYCFDLRFYKPRVEQIKAFALSLASKEGLSIPHQAMEQIIIGANQDIRQVVHNLQMWTSTKTSLTYDEAKEHAKNASKNIKIGPFDIVKTLYTNTDASKMNLHEKTDLFFNDHSFVPLFMQENYLSVNPKDAKNQKQHLELISKTADAISDGNMVERLIRSEQSWSLLPLQGLYSTVLPSNYMAGYLGGQIGFPQWLGKNSSRNKHDRILQELKVHLSLSANCMKSDINLDYLSSFKTRLGRPLTDSSKEPNSAAKEVISFMESYNLNRDDWDSVMEIGKWGNESDIMSKIPTKVKSAFTRLYNKESHKNPYVTHQPAKKMKVKADDGVLKNEDDGDDVDDNSDGDGSDNDITKDAMIKVKKETKSDSKPKKTATKKPASSKSTKPSPSSSKGKGKGKK